MEPICPTSHPFAFAQGTKCCKYYEEVDDTDLDPACDGGPLGSASPAACCPAGESVDCSAGICSDNPSGESMISFLLRTD